MRADTQNWIATAEYDLETARHMLATSRHLYVVFLCHLALEKMLKAHVAEVARSIPVRTHDLIYLVKKSELSLPQPHLEFIGKINNVSIVTRYPEDLQRTLLDYPEPIVRDYLKHTDEVLQWLRQHPNLQA